MYPEGKLGYIDSKGAGNVVININSSSSAGDMTWIRWLLHSLCSCRRAFFYLRLDRKELLLHFFFFFLYFFYFSFYWIWEYYKERARHERALKRPGYTVLSLLEWWCNSQIFSPFSRRRTRRTTEWFEIICSNIILNSFLTEQIHLYNGVIIWNRIKNITNSKRPRLWKKMLEMAF